MIEQRLVPGVVLKPDWDERPIRVLACDSDEIIYDYWLPHENSWSLSSLRARAVYLRVSMQFALSRVSYLRMDALSDDEYSVHRPDLPLRLGQSLKLQWSREPPASIADLLAEIDRLDHSMMESFADTTIDAAKLFLLPFGPKDGPKPSVPVEARNGQAFTVADLLWHAWHAQAPHLGKRRLTHGVGLYRCGFERRTPSYYIWGARSMLQEEA